MSTLPVETNNRELSKKLLAYLQEVELATNRKVSLNPVPASSPHKDIKGILLIGPWDDRIKIEYSPPLPPTHPAIEKAIAHELTHALLIYEEDYPIVRADEKISEDIVQKAADIMDIIDDIIVDTRLQSRGFSPTTKEHLQSYINNTRVFTLAEQRSQVGTPYPDDPIRTEIKFVGDYLYA